MLSNEKEQKIRELCKSFERDNKEIMVVVPGTNVAEHISLYYCCGINNMANSIVDMMHALFDIGEFSTDDIESFKSYVDNDLGEILKRRTGENITRRFQA